MSCCSQDYGQTPRYLHKYRLKQNTEHPVEKSDNETPKLRSISNEEKQTVLNVSEESLPQHLNSNLEPFKLFCIILHNCIGYSVKWNWSDSASIMVSLCHKLPSTFLSGLEKTESNLYNYIRNAMVLRQIVLLQWGTRFLYMGEEVRWKMTENFSEAKQTNWVASFVSESKYFCCIPWLAS